MFILLTLDLFPPLDWARSKPIREDITYVTSSLIGQDLAQPQRVNTFCSLPYSLCLFFSLSVCLHCRSCLCCLQGSLHLLLCPSLLSRHLLFSCLLQPKRTSIALTTPTFASRRSCCNDPTSLQRSPPMPTSHHQGEAHQKRYGNLEFILHLLNHFKDIYICMSFLYTSIFNFGISCWTYPVSRGQCIQIFFTCLTSKKYAFSRSAYTEYRRKLCSNPYAHMVVLFALGPRAMGYAQPRCQTRTLKNDMVSDIGPDDLAPCIAIGSEARRLA